jgi:pyridoxal 5'-phosphate synthase pdxS subunit
LRRISEGAAMIRTKGEAGTGNVVEAVRHARALMREVHIIIILAYLIGSNHFENQINKVKGMSEDELYSYAKEIQAPVELVQQVKQLGRLPVVNFAAGGVVSNSKIFVLEISQSDLSLRFKSARFVF